MTLCLSEMVNRIPGISLISHSHQDFYLTTEYSQCDNLHQLSPVLWGFEALLSRSFSACQQMKLGKLKPTCTPVCITVFYHQALKLQFAILEMVVFLLTVVTVCSSNNARYVMYHFMRYLLFLQMIKVIQTLCLAQQV